MEQMNDEVLIRFLLKESATDEQLAVNKWIDDSEANAKYFAQLEKIWLTSKNLKPKQEVDVEAAWTKFKNKTSTQPQSKPQFNWLRVAAVLFLAIGAWTAYSVFGPTKYTTLMADKEVLSQTLPDGSELTLNKFSNISYVSNFKNQRHIQFKNGEVFFNVAKDKHKPFVITIDKIAVEVMGTSFNIKHLNQQTEIVVETGVVQVSLANEEIKLYKGERITIDSKTKQLQKTSNEDQLYNYYRSHLFITDNTPLTKLITTLNEAYASHIQLDSATKNLSITTTLKYGSLTNNLEIICETLDLKMTRNQNEILLSNRK